MELLFINEYIVALNQQYVYMCVALNFETLYLPQNMEKITVITIQPYRLIKQMNISPENPIGGFQLWICYRRYINVIHPFLLFQKVTFFTAFCHK